MPDAGVSLEYVPHARERPANNLRSARDEGKFWELSGGMLRCAECGGGMRARTTKRRKGNKDYYYSCTNANLRRGCDHRTLYRAERLEQDVMTEVDDLLSEPGRITRDVEAAIKREREKFHHQDATAALWAQKLAASARKREAYQDQQAAGLMTLEELGRRLAVLDEERAIVEEELRKLSHSREHIKELEARRRTVLEMFGTGLKIGLYLLPPGLRRRVYELLGLRVIVGCGGRFELEGIVDADAVELTRETWSNSLGVLRRWTSGSGASRRVLQSLSASRGWSGSLRRRDGRGGGAGSGKSTAKSTARTWCRSSGIRAVTRSGGPGSWGSLRCWREPCWISCPRQLLRGIKSRRCIGR